MGSVTIARKPAVWRDRMRAYSVVVDGKTVGKVASDEEVSIALTPGPHKLRLPLDWCGSPTIAVDGDADTRLVCEAGGHSLMALIDMLFRSNQYISLARA